MSRMSEMRDLSLAAPEPTFTHCAHIFQDEWRRGAYGPWCHNPVQNPGDLCANHDPERQAKKRARTRQTRSERRRAATFDVAVTDADIRLLHTLGVVDALSEGA